MFLFNFSSLVYLRIFKLKLLELVGLFVSYALLGFYSTLQRKKAWVYACSYASSLKFEQDPTKMRDARRAIT